jgi:TetR/AcrR family transcriptional repressor of lmrAB and yxaGH operons
MPRPRTAPDHPDSPARAIAIAMAGALRRRGYHGAALNDVVAESGAPRGSVYHHFPQGKDAIGAAAVRLVGGGVTRALAPRGPVAPTGREAIAVIAAQLSEWLQRSGFDEGCPVVGAAMGLGPDTPLTREACADAFGAWTDALAAVYREGGVEASRAVPLARLSIAALEGAVGLCRAQRSIEPMRQVAAELGALLDGARAHGAALPSQTAPSPRAAPPAPPAARRPGRAR